MNTRDHVASQRQQLRRAQRLAYRSGSPIWWCNLAAFYAMGEGCDADPVRARTWYQKAARAGDARGLYELGFMYLTGEGGPRHAALGRSLLIRAASQDEIDALKVLAHGFATGAWGFAASKARAEAIRRRLRRALKQARRQRASRPRTPDS